MTDHTETIYKPRRKLKISHFILAVLVVAIAGFVWFRLNTRSKLQSRLDAIRAAGYPVTCPELNAWYSIPESSTNAADTILEAFSNYYEWDKEHLQELPIVGRAELPGRTEPMTEEMKALVAEYLADNKTALDLLHKGSAIEHCRYPVDLTQGIDTLVPHLGDIREGARILHLEAVLHAENDEPQLAADSIAAIFGVARSLDNEPLVISQLVRIACRALGASSLERVVNRTQLTDEQLADLGNILDNYDRSVGLSLALAGERCVMTDFLKDPLTHDLSIHTGSSLPTPMIFLYKPVGLADADALLYVDLMTDYMEAMELEPHLRSKAFEAVQNKVDNVSRIHVLLRTLMPSRSTCATQDLRCMATCETARVALAVQRYRLAAGKLPESIGQLVPAYLDTIVKDPFDGNELRYKKLDVGFTVYSVGEDRQDDGGAKRTPRSRRRKASGSYDVTFTVER